MAAFRFELDNKRNLGLCRDIISIINDQFSDIVFTNVGTKGNICIYAACIASQLAGGYKRYVLLMTNTCSINPAANCSISDVNWHVFQTRQLYDSYKLRPQRWTPKKITDIVLRNVGRSARESKYQPESCIGSEQPYDITLLHDPKKKTEFQYHNKITLIAAIESFGLVFKTTENIGRPYQRHISVYDDTTTTPIPDVFDAQQGFDYDARSQSHPTDSETGGGFIMPPGIVPHNTNSRRHGYHTMTTLESSPKEFEQTSPDWYHLDVQPSGVDEHLEFDDSSISV